MSNTSAPRITLYGPAATPYTIKVVRALHWKRVSFGLEEPKQPEDFKRWSPQNGLLPVIDLDGTRVQDSVAILDEDVVSVDHLALLRRTGTTATAGHNPCTCSSSA
ncbi:MAG: glutathione S-transferase N-terminal domain-containing protein, partial [Myxococcota bacterium]